MRARRHRRPTVARVAREVGKELGMPLPVVRLAELAGTVLVLVAMAQEVTRSLTASVRSFVRFWRNVAELVEWLAREGGPMRPTGSALSNEN